MVESVNHEPHTLFKRAMKPGVIPDFQEKEKGCVPKYVEVIE